MRKVLAVVVVLLLGHLVTELGKGGKYNSRHTH